MNRKTFVAVVAVMFVSLGGLIVSGAVGPSVSDGDVEEYPGEKYNGSPAHDTGESFTINGVDYTVNNVGEIQHINQYEADGKFVVVDVSAENNGRDKAWFLGSVHMVGSQDETYNLSDRVYLLGMKGVLNFESVDPGESGEGILVYEVPEDVDPKGLWVGPPRSYYESSSHFVSLSDA